MAGLRHVSTLTLRDDASPATIEAIVTALRELPGQIPELRGYVVGSDVGRSDGNATIAVVADFDDWSSYEVYRDHPAHVSIAADMILPVLTGRAAVQHEVD